MPGIVKKSFYWTKKIQIADRRSENMIADKKLIISIIRGFSIANVT